MRLTYTCSTCKKQNYLKLKASSRADLQMKFGDEMKVNCNSCGKFEKRHINRISAVVDNRQVVGGFVAGLIIVLLSGVYLFSSLNTGIAWWKVIAAAGSTIAGIPVFLWNRENKVVGDFNRYAIRRD